MRIRLATLALLGALGLLPAAAQAQSVIDPVDGPVTLEEARNTAIENGLRQIEDMEYNRYDRRWEVDGRDIDGRWVEMDIDANTGEVIRVDR